MLWLLDDAEQRAGITIKPIPGEKQQVASGDHACELAEGCRMNVPGGGGFFSSLAYSVDVIFFSFSFFSPLSPPGAKMSFFFFFSLICLVQNDIFTR